MSANGFANQKDLYSVSRIVFLNWRDSRHPQAGGAELYCESVAKRMVSQGHEVTLLTAAVADAARDEVVDGLQIRRRGGRFSVYLHALAWLLLNRRHFDGVVDFQNGIPFFSPLAVGKTKPVVCVIFHVHQDQFNLYFPWPVNRIGQWLEGPLARRIYGSRVIVAISPSTRSDVRRKLKPRGPLYVLPCGMDSPARLTRGQRSPSPRIVSVGRLVPHKQLDLLIATLPEVLLDVPDLTVDIAGSGPAEAGLRRQVAELHLTSVVTFHGRVSDDERDRMLSEAWLTVNPSAGEGWGLSVLEANASGTPAVAFEVPGLQDAIVDGQTGWLVGNGETLARTIARALRTLSDPVEAAFWEQRVLNWSRQFNWDSTSLRFEALLEHERERLQSVFEDPRAPSDLACCVELPATPGTLSAVRLISRRTDVWRRDGSVLVGLMHETDEEGVRAAMRRAGIDLDDHVQIRPARSHDWLTCGVPAAMLDV